ncbi:copper resistance protein B [Vibrio kanaloae]|uniref:copper resistance protein B n=1 Tax=Vibrio TaxID=662 RepID=UPI002088090B|nr:Copper resistance protein B [Vibrio cholerae]|tara:strand:- start:122 stop:850 length:729 start_codon:yes stop_codon:yes gene_type:complete
MRQPMKKMAPLLCSLSLILASQVSLAVEPKNFWGIQFEEFEYRYDDDSGDKLGVWDGDTFYGTDEYKFRWLTKGEYDDESSKFSTLENQFVIQTPISDFFDAKAGLRFDTPEGENRSYAVIGLAGLAPQWFEVDLNFYISEKGDASADIDAEYELLLTNQLILTASLAADIAFSNDVDIGIGSGLNSTEFGLRLSYDVIDRSFSPYIGVVQENLYGKTADLAEDEGESTDELFFVVGAKIIF